MDERIFINTAIAVISGGGAAMASHFNLRSRVSTIEASLKAMKETQDTMAKQVGETREDVAWIKGKMDGDGK